MVLVYLLNMTKGQYITYTYIIHYIHIHYIHDDFQHDVTDYLK